MCVIYYQIPPIRQSVGLKFRLLFTSFAFFLLKFVPHLYLFLYLRFMKVTLREKNISQGKKKSLYLDYYPPISDPATGKETRREFLGLYLYSKPKSKEERDINKESRTKADYIWAMRQKQIIKGDFSFLLPEGTDTVEALIDELISETKNPTSLRYFKSLASDIKAYSGKRELTYALFTPEFCQGYINSLRTRKNQNRGKEHLNISQNTAALYATTFLKFIKRAETRDKVINVTRKIKSIAGGNTSRTFLSLDEIKRLIETPVHPRQQRVKEACLFSAFSGLRKGDVLSLKWSNVVEDNGNYFLHFKQEKGDRPEYIPLNPSAVEVLGERGTNKITDKVFAGVTITKITYLLLSWPKEAGIEQHITFHAFRHSFASMLVKKGVNMAIIMKLLTHKNISTTMIYTHIDTDEKQNAVNKLVFK